ncbi:glycoside hydrolase family 16 protein [Neolentinus lepideus HHB14362 ss-1]|uniref:Glycoside hydrolase family 16 protein n=1 Tax=Neolentinus lepideus HHB14362 ss-1 TaxID=1314782 RepID=A0A165QC41_9AGAM|nr:glycoside hydrolase family 16 protein [Neolentinus lepideus HHB14362 ss-1]
MRTGYIHLFLSAAALITPLEGVSARFRLNQTYTGDDFLSGWTWETMDDPTHGRTNYVDQGTALSQNLTYATDTKFVMRADDFNVVPPSARGRNSVRISSNQAWDESLIVIDLAHMPEGCSTWPAFWSLSQKGPWPNGGEIDIVEGVNLGNQNLASLHTTPNCNMPQQQQRVQTGQTTSTICDASVNFNQGCGVSFSKPGSFGAPFNQQGGGYFAMARTKADGVRLWFWPRGDSSVPQAIANPDALPTPNLPIRKRKSKTQDKMAVLDVVDIVGSDTIAPDESWGWPEAAFPTGDSNCGYEQHFDAHQMVFDLTFCGDWAGSAWSTAGCGSGSCVDFVNNNPTAFSNAYWEVNSIRVYTPY